MFKRFVRKKSQQYEDSGISGPVPSFLQRKGSSESHISAPMPSAVAKSWNSTSDALDEHESATRQKNTSVDEIHIRRHFNNLSEVNSESSNSKYSGDMNHRRERKNNSEDDRRREERYRRQEESRSRDKSRERRREKSRGRERLKDSDDDDARRDGRRVERRPERPRENDARDREKIKRSERSIRDGEDKRSDRSRSDRERDRERQRDKSRARSERNNDNQERREDDKRNIRKKREENDDSRGERRGRSPARQRGRPSRSSDDSNEFENRKKETSEKRQREKSRGEGRREREKSRVREGERGKSKPRDDNEVDRERREKSRVREGAREKRRDDERERARERRKEKESSADSKDSEMRRRENSERRHRRKAKEEEQTSDIDERIQKERRDRAKSREVGRESGKSRRERTGGSNSENSDEVPRSRESTWGNRGRKSSLGSRVENMSDDGKGLRKSSYPEEVFDSLLEDKKSIDHPDDLFYEAHLEPVGRDADDFQGRLQRRANKTRTRIMTKLPPKALSDAVVNTIDSPTTKTKGSKTFPREFITELMKCLQEDKTEKPVPLDFESEEGYRQWRKITRKASFQKALMIILDHFCSKSDPFKEANSIEKSENACDIRLKIVAARDLLVKDGKTRNPYATVKFDGSHFETNVAHSTTSPTWEEEFTISVTSVNEPLVIEVFDKPQGGGFFSDKKDEFLGHARIKMSDLVKKCQSAQTVASWVKLQRKSSKDKYAGGELRIEAQLLTSENMTSENVKSPMNAEELEKTLIKCRADFSSLYEILLRACILHDMHVAERKLQEKNIDATNMDNDIVGVLLSDSKSLLLFIGRRWNLSEPFRAIAYMKQLGNLYREGFVSIRVFKDSYRNALDFAMGDNKTSLTSDEKFTFLDLMKEVADIIKEQLSSYEEYFRKNKNGVIQECLQFLRSILKNPWYMKEFGDTSFREDLIAVLQARAINRYGSFSEEFTADGNANEDETLQGLVKLGETIMTEMDIDLKYYQKGFEKDVDLISYNSEVYIKCYVLEMENLAAMIHMKKSEVESSIASVFALYRVVRMINEQYIQYAPDYKFGINLDKWFKPFVFKWLTIVQNKTVEWVRTALEVDKFEPVSEDSYHSSSVTDMFSVITENYQLLVDLDWHDQLQQARFVTRFSRSINVALEQYCDAIETREQQQDGGSKWIFTKATTSLASVDINHESCVKLSNIEFARAGLKKLEKTIGVSNVKKILASSREDKPRSDKSKLITGTFTLEVTHAKNLPKVESAASVVVSYITGSQDAINFDKRTRQSFHSDQDNQEEISSPLPEGNQEIEIGRTNGSKVQINPTWEEVFQASLRYSEYLQLVVIDKKFWTSSETIAKGKIDLVKHKKLYTNYQHHDIWVTLEPQGRILLRLAMEGDNEDIGFYFRKTHERFKRVQDDLVRFLVNKMVPPISELMKAMFKKLEVVVNKGFFGGFGATPLTEEQKEEANRKVTTEEAEALMQPLTDYLDKNLETIAVNLSDPMAQLIVAKTWREALVQLEDILVPQLHGNIERDRRPLSVKQLSMMTKCLKILLEFFHAGGEGLGLPMKTLQVTRFKDITTIIKAYQLSTDKLKMTYEESTKRGSPKSCLLQVLRLRVDDISAQKFVEEALLEMKKGH